MKPSLPLLALVSLLGITITGCSQATEPTATPSALVVESIGATPTHSPSTSAAPQKSARGNYIRVPGDTARMWTGADKKTTVVFTINSITVDPQCTAPYAQPAEKGHFVVLDASIETMPELANASYDRFDLSPHGWQFVGANGTTYNGSLASGASYSCMTDSEILPINGVGPGEKVTGKIILDVPATTGTLVFKPLGGAIGGWEWAF